MYASSYLRVLLGLTVLACLADACGSESAHNNTVRLGLMLPFTGDLSSTSANHERAVLLAKAEIERAGLGGGELEIVFADSHSSVAEGLKAADALLEKDVSAIIGFESDELALALIPRLHERGVVLITPGVSSRVASKSDEVWFRVAPSTKAMAENLAKQLFARGITRASVLFTKDRYNASFAAAFAERMRGLGAVVPAEVTVDVERRTYPEALAALHGEPGIVLAAPAEVAARVVNEFYAARERPTWFLTPALRSAEFVFNASPDSLAGALGIAPEVTVDREFAGVFAERFHGDMPLDSALFYYDAAALFVLAYQRAYVQNGEQAPGYDALVASMFDAAYPVGVETTWKELAPALRDLSDGAPRYYRGLTGPIVFGSDGERGVGAPKLWTIDALGEIVDL